MKYVSMFDFNNDKGNLNILGFDRKKYPKAEIWEVSDNITFSIIHTGDAGWMIQVKPGMI